MSALFPRSRLHTVLGAWSEHPTVDYALGAAVLAAAFAPAWRGTADVLAAAGQDDLTGLYQTLVGLSGVLLGFILTAFSIYQALTPTARLQRLVRHHRETIDRTFMACMRYCAFAAAAFLTLSVAAATGITGPLSRAGAYAVTVVLALRTVRLLWMFTGLTEKSAPTAAETTAG